MKYSFLFTLLFLSAVMVFAQSDSRDLSKTPTQFNNPMYVYGPQPENPLDITESFENATFPPAGWTKANPDGGTGWERQLDGTTPIPGWTGGTITVPPGGGTAVAFCTWTTGGASANDQWLISPQINNVQPGDMLTFWMRVFANDSYAENVDIRISTTGTNVGDFTTIVEAFAWPVGGIADEWFEYSYELTNYVAAGSDIYIAWREHVLDNFNDGAAVLLDLVEVTQGGSTTTFFDDFDSYTSGQQLACQNPTDWTTWSNLPCDPVEDAYISTNYAYSGANSTVIVQNNDLVKPLGHLTSGEWYISVLIYIPTGKAGYFNTLAGFTPNPFNWGMECYFDAGGGGRLFGGSATAYNFTWQENTWQQAVVRVNLDIDQATFWFGSDDPLTEIATWQWTLGANGGGSPLQLDANDFFGATANDEMYFDNYYFGDAMPPIIPVELTSFTAIANNGIVELNWETATEVNNHLFEIERKTDASEFITIGFVEGHGTTTEPQSYGYRDANVGVGTYTYRLKQIDFDGTYSYSDYVEVYVAPTAFNLEQNYPNPFNPSTKISYSVPEAGNVKLSVYNLVGEEVAVLVNGYTDAGQFEVSFDASNLSSGVYLYKLQSANSVITKKMTLLK